MLWTETEAGKINGAQQRLWVALGEHASNVAEWVNKDPKFVKRLARFAVNQGAEPWTSPKVAREIMGENMFSSKDATEYFGIRPTRDQTNVLSRVPFSEKELADRNSSHILVAVFPLSILDLRIKAQDLVFRSDVELQKLPGAHNRGEVGWKLIGKSDVNCSSGKNWADQLKLLLPFEAVPTAQELVYTIAGYFLATGEQLFKWAGVKTLNVNAAGNHIQVGPFSREPDGLNAPNKPELWICSEEKSQKCGLAHRTNYE